MLLLELDNKTRFKDANTITTKEIDFLSLLGNYFQSSIGSTTEKLENFTKYVPRQALTTFISRYEIFKKVLTVQGSIVECGVFFGGGLMTFAQLSSIFEPVNSQRKIIGFDTFSGFPEVTAKDYPSSETSLLERGGLAIDSYDDIAQAIALFDSNRFLRHIGKVELVRGDATKTIPEYLNQNPHTVVSLLYLDFDIYLPTKTAIEHFVPRMPRGAVIAFDELNSKFWKGETIALLDTLGIGKLKLERFAHDSYLSFAVLD
jgi:hypothetical protein